jgi:hypothetical protein
MRICRRAAFTVVSTILILASGPAAEAQQVVRLGERPSCAECRVRLEPVVRLGSLDPPGDVANVARLARDARGNYYATNQFEPGRIRVFGPDGSYRATLGRIGSGPGEFQQQAMAFVVDDSLRVFDYGNGRQSVFDAELNFVRSTNNAPVPLDFIRVESRVLLTALNRAPDAAGRPVHEFDLATGRVVRSLGEPAREPTPQGMADARRVIAAGRGETFWAAARREYSIEQWGLDGTLRRRLVRAVDWFPPFRPGTPQYEQPPQGSIQAVREDADGLLWVLTSVPAREWRQAYERSTQTGPHGPVPIVPLLYDTVIDVIDPATGQIVTTARTPAYLRGFVGEDVFGYEEDELGVGYLRIYRVELVGGSNGRFGSVAVPCSHGRASVVQ